MVGVDAGEELVFGAVGVQPAVVVAVLGPGSEVALALVPALDALAGEVPHAEFLAQRPHLGLVALVQQPDVDRAAVPDPTGRGQCGPDHRDGFLAGHTGRDEGDPGAGLRANRYRVPGEKGAVD